MNYPTSELLSVSPVARLEHGAYCSRILQVLSNFREQVVVHSRKRSLTAAEFRTRVLSARDIMRQHGVRRGSVVGILTAPNSPDCLMARYAANLLGAAALHLGTVNAADATHQLDVRAQVAIARGAAVTMIVIDDATQATGRMIRDRALCSLTLAAFDALPDVVDLSTGSPGEAPDVVADDSIAVITYTSGQTGPPRGVARSLRAWSATVNAFAGSGKKQALQAQSGSASATQAAPGMQKPRLLVTTPLSHTVGPMADATLATGGTLVLHENFDPDAALRAVAQYQVTWMLLATPHVYQLLECGELGRADLSSLHHIVYGGTVASGARIAAAVSVFGPIFRQSYGTTETWGITALAPTEHLRADLLQTVGRTLPGIELSVLDPETDAELPVGSTGEICVRSPLMMDGYWMDPELTARVLRGGRAHTGDLGFVDEAGYVHLVGRIGDVIKARGLKIHPAEMEKALLTHADVVNAAVFGVRDANNLEHVQAAVVLRNGSRTTPADLHSHAVSQLASAPASIQITVRDALPMTDTGKPDKVRLRAEAERQLASSLG